jgi:exodeoxyribonuclease VIII
MSNLMIDFETLDTKPTAVVLSLGLVLFSNEKIISKTYREFFIDDQLKDGRTVSGDTLTWWFQQSEEAQKIFSSDNKILVCDFLSQMRNIKNAERNLSEVLLWGNGVKFDNAILTNLFEMYGVESPFKFWNDRCYRTFNALTNCRSLVKREGTHHNALDDAIFQAKTMIAYFKKNGSESDTWDFLQ